MQQSPHCLDSNAASPRSEQEQADGNINYPPTIRTTEYLVKSLWISARLQQRCSSPRKRGRRPTLGVASASALAWGSRRDSNSRPSECHSDPPPVTSCHLLSRFACSWAFHCYLLFAHQQSNRALLQQVAAAPPQQPPRSYAQPYPAAHTFSC